MYQTGEINTHCFRGGGAMKLLHLPNAEATTLLEAPQGIIRDPEVHFDGQRILFSMRRNVEDDYHLCEIDLPKKGAGVVCAKHAEGRTGKRLPTPFSIHNFTRPERSLCLKALGDTADSRYARALELIRQGQRNLQEHPRCDMPGFVPCEAHQKQLNRLAQHHRHSAERQIGDWENELEEPP